MRPDSMLFAAATVLAAACATPAPLPLQLAVYERGRVIDGPCREAMAQAAQRQARGGFGLVDREVAQVIGPPAAEVTGSAPGAAPQTWLSKRGGVIDRTVWFGPFAL